MTNQIITAYARSIDLFRVTAMKHNLIAQVSGQFLGRLLFYIFLLYTARILGAKGFGAFSFALSIGYIIYGIMDFGLDTLCVRSVAREEADRYFLLAAAKVITTGIGLTIILCISLFFEESLRIIIIVLGFGFSFFSFLNFISSYFRGIEKMYWEAVLLMAQRAGILFITILLFLVWKTGIAASVAFLLSLFFTLVVGILLLQEYVKEPITRYFNFRKNEIADVLREAFPLAMVGFVWAIYYRIDGVILASFRSMSEVGLYNGAYKIIEGIILLSRVIMMVTFPRLSKLGKEKGLEFYSFFNIVFWLLITLALIIAGIMFFASTFAFKLILGGQYTDSVVIFKTLLISVLVMYPGYLVTHALIAIDQQKIYLYVIMFGALFNIGFNFTVIPTFGAIGAAWAKVCTDIIIIAACAFFLLRSYRKLKCESA